MFYFWLSDIWLIPLGTALLGDACDIIFILNDLEQEIQI